MAESEQVDDEERIMRRRDVPEHIREAAFIMRNVFTRMRAAERQTHPEDEWEEDDDAALA